MQDKVEALAAARRVLKDEQDNLRTVEADIELAFGKRLGLAKAQLSTARADVQDAGESITRLYDKLAVALEGLGFARERRWES